MERRLAAILVADVVGYSRLVSADEEGTIARFNAVREETIDPGIARHGGRIVKTMGDGLLVEFSSVVDAVRAAVEVQEAMAERAAAAPEDQRIVLRMGINLGDIVVEGDDILGDGVNVAARLEALSDPGGICISLSVRDQIRDKLEVGLEDQGELAVKNIARPVRVLRVLVDGSASPAGSEGVERFVLSAEVRSFALLMGDNDDQARRDLEHNRGYFTRAIGHHRGRTLGTAGDGSLAVFSIPGDAIRSAIEAQTAVAAWNDSVPPERRIRFRVGIGVADEGVVSDPDGRGAAALEALAGPGEICVGREVRERLAGDESLQFEELGDAPDNSAAFRLILPARPASPIGRHLPPQCQALDLPLPAKPSIIVLPFKNLSDDPEQNHLAEGIRIDIQCALVKISGLFAIAAGTASSYGGRDVSATQVGKEMGVRYVLEGTIQRSGNQVRITAQLTDAESGRSVWAERYDRKLDNSFLVQDEIVEKVVTALDVKLVGGEQAKVWRKTLRDPKALELYYKGLELLISFNKESVTASRQLFEAVSRMAPNVTLGPTSVAFCHYWDVIMGWSDSAEDSLAQAEDWAGKAVAMDDADGQGHIILAHVHLLKRRHDEALRIGEEAVRIRPLCANTNALFGNILIYCGQPATAIERVKNAIRYAPVYAPWWVEVLAIAYRDAGQYGRAISAAKEALRLNPGQSGARAILASACVAGGWLEAAREIAGNILELDPGFSLSSYARQHPYQDQAKLEAILAGLREAGLPD